MAIEKKVCKSSARLGILQQCTWRHRGYADAIWPAWTSRPLRFWNLKNLRWRRPACWKIKKSPYFGRGATDFTKFGILMQFGVLNRYDRLNMKLLKSKILTVQAVKFLKIQDTILKNLKIAISWPQFDRFWQNLVRWCNSTLLNVPTVKILKFRKFKMAAAGMLKN